MNSNRRDFLKTIGFSIAAIPFIGFLTSAKAGKKAAPEASCPTALVSEDDPVAKAIDYKHDIKNVDYAKYPNRKKPDQKNNFCDNCSLYSSLNKGCGKCQMLANGSVNAKGWCGSWAKK